MIENLDNSLAEVLKKMLELKTNFDVGRMGKLFNTNLNNYFYDTGTGKVFKLDDKQYRVLLYFFNENINFTKFKGIIECDENYESVYNLLEVVKNENLLSNPKLNKLYTPKHCDALESTIQTELRQVTLELTGRCNLRCRYCIYNEGYMRIEILMKVI